MPKSAPAWRRVGVTLWALVALAAPRCAGEPDARAIDPVYNPESGRLEEVRLDANLDGKPEAVNYMDAARLVRTEVDQDQDGLVERWEYYGPGNRLEKVGFSTRRDGWEDAWVYANPDASPARIAISESRDGRVTRTEFYENGVLTRVETDTDRNGRVDRWERFRGGTLLSISFDTAGRGTPDRRLTYRPDGAATLEVDPDGDGVYEPR